MDAGGAEIGGWATAAGSVACAIRLTDVAREYL